MVLSEVLKLVSDRYNIVHSTPGGGSYDCLGLADERDEVLLLNRAGESALLENGRVISEIWARAARSPRETARFLLSQAEIPHGDDANDQNVPAIRAAVTIANFLSSAKSDPRHAHVVWSNPQSPDAQQAFSLDNISVPASWLETPVPAGLPSASAELVALTESNELVAVMNLATGAAIKPNGTNWNLSVRASQARDENRLPVAPIAFALIDEGHPKLTVRPSMFLALKWEREERSSSASYKVLTELDSEAEVQSVWQDIDNFFD